MTLSYSVQKIIGGVLFLTCLVACGDTKQAPKTINRIPTIPIETDLIIGQEQDQADSLVYILGEPVAVRTDEAGNIYIADRASLTVKVFDAKGNYLKSLGGRGRGPTEFYDLNLMERTPEGNFLFLDRGNLRYTTLTKEGEFVSSYTIKLANQFYLKGIEYYNDKLLGMYLGASIPKDPSEVFSRKFFHVFSTNLENRYTSFAPFHQLGIDDMFAWNTIGIYSGSIALLDKYEWLVFSPGIYIGTIYLYQKGENDDWNLYDTFKATAPYTEPYYIFESEEQYKTAKDYPGSNLIHFSGGPYMGKLNSLDAGIFYLPERDQIVHFYAEWREGNVTLEEGNPLDLSVQVFDLEGNILGQSYLLSMQYDRRTNYTLVNWMDEHENFYLLDYSSGEPAVRRFTLDLPQ